MGRPLYGFSRPRQLFGVADAGFCLGAETDVGVDDMGIFAGLFGQIGEGRNLTKCDDAFR